MRIDKRRAYYVCDIAGCSNHSEETDQEPMAIGWQTFKDLMGTPFHLCPDHGVTFKGPEEYQSDAR